MSIEYFSWSATNIAELGLMLNGILDWRVAAFREQASEQGGDSEDRLVATSFLSALRSTIVRWCDHLEVRRAAIASFTNYVGWWPENEPLLRGYAQSWNTEIRAERVIGDIQAELQRANTYGDEVFRPKVLEHANREVMEWLKRRPDFVDRVHDRSFEHIVAEVIRDKGWQVEVTKRTRDGGYDVLGIRTDELGFSMKVLVECKLFDLSRTVGLPMVDRLMGVSVREHADFSTLVTNARFTNSSWSEWEANVGRRLRLVDREELFRWLTEYGSTRAR